MMLVKFETKTNRVKGVAFHPKRPWVLASLHNGTVQIWDYRMGTVVGQWREHEGPVRGCAFHPSQPLFATGGDDAKVRVFNWQQRKCLFTLSGHHDYIRSVAFHHELPWILTASDDQTIRIWNWQSRQCIAQLTGHCHYVMSAQFHPKDDLVVSASLDQTIRVWDIGGIRRKGSISGGGGEAAGDRHSFDNGPLSPRSLAQIELFSNGGAEGSVKFILEGHDRGVNCAQFHPTKPFILSGSDDRSVKLWRYNESRAWETETLRGHFNNVSAVLFHPHQDMTVLSDSEDKTIRLWDLNRKAATSGASSSSGTFRREHDRYWALAAHPSLNLFVAGHDSGLVVFKLEKERPAHVLAEDRILYCLKDRVVRAVDLQSSSETVVATLEQKIILPTAMAYNPAERILLVSSAGSSDAGYSLVPTATSKSSQGSLEKGHGAWGVWTGRHSFAVYDPVDRRLILRSLSSKEQKLLAVPEGFDRLLPSGTPGTFWMAGPTRVQLLREEDGKLLAIATLPIPNIKYAVWSSDMTRVALFGKSVLCIASRDGSILGNGPIQEPTLVKSAVWDGELVYFTNANHLKYLLPNGHSGIVCTLNQPLYLVRVKGDLVQGLERGDSPLRQFRIDPTEAVFKLALAHGDMAKVEQLVQSGRLLGQSIIAYLRQTGHPDIALHFVQDPFTRFELALESADLQVALEAARLLSAASSRDCWIRLAGEAIKLGIISIAEEALRQAEDYGRLAFLNLVSGHKAGLLEIANSSNDASVRLQCQIWLGETAQGSFAQSLEEAGLEVLAWQVHKLAGNESEAKRLAKASPHSDNANNLARPPSASATSTILDDSCVKPKAWPLFATSKSLKGTTFQEEAHFETGGNLLFEPPADSTPGGWDDELEVDLGDLEISKDHNDYVEEEEEDPRQVLRKIAKQVPFDHFIAGSTDRGLELLNRQAGIVEVAPLMETIERINGVAEDYWRSLEQLLPVASIYANPTETDLYKRRARPLITLDDLSSRYQEALDLTTAGKFAEAIEVFQKVLCDVLFVRLDEAEEMQTRIVPLIEGCREYLIGLGMEIERKELMTGDEESQSRALQLACYFCHVGIGMDHQLLACKSAMTFAYRLKCLKLAGHLARRLVDLSSTSSTTTTSLPEQTILQARKVIALADRTDQADPIEPDNYDQSTRATLTIDPWKHVAISRGEMAKKCPFCKASYLADPADQQPEGRICRVCGVAKIGQPATGLILWEDYQKDF